MYKRQIVHALCCDEQNIAVFLHNLGEGDWHLMLYNISDSSLVYRRHFDNIYEYDQYLLPNTVYADMGKNVVAAAMDYLGEATIGLRVWRRGDGEPVFACSVPWYNGSMLVIGDKIVVGSCESLFIYEYRDREVVIPRMVTVPPRPQDEDGGGWYLPREVSLEENRMWMTSDIASPSTWLVTVGETVDEEWLVVNRWNMVDETHNKSVMVARGKGLPEGFILKNAQLLVLMRDGEDGQRLIVSDVETGNVTNTVKLDTTGGLTG